MKGAITKASRVWIIAILAVVALPCLGGEVAVLKNGFSIKHQRHEVVGELTRLYVSADGSSFVDVPTSEIEHFETVTDEPDSGSPPFARHAKDGAPMLAAKAKMTGFPARPTTDLSTVVNEASGRYRLDPDLVNSVIKAESGFNVRAVSPKGAQGLMQLMPGTASQLGVPNTFDPQANVEGGTKYLRELLERYNFDLVKALAAYNAGPQRVEQFGGVPPYYETRAYVARVVKDFNKKKVAQEKAAASQKSASKGKKAQGAAAKSAGAATVPATAAKRGE
ncbi:MAG TPA: lytic transglycosylase domain-containing protein [Candidatus Dormibacteraeota bacterium]|nr:lytic transglycosylase domain-containing protein [Candidatus Dormibacteraeota bacterium]